MKKPFKKVAPAPAPSAPPAPPAPPPTKIELLRYMWKRERDRQEEVLQDFRDSIAKPNDDGTMGSIVYHLEWKGEVVMLAEAFLYIEMRGMDALLTEHAEDMNFIQERLEVKSADIIQDLTGGKFGGGGQGPWRHNSSGALANVNNMAKCDAKREVFRVLQNMLEVIAE